MTLRTYSAVILTMSLLAFPYAVLAVGYLQEDEGRNQKEFRLPPDIVPVDRAIGDAMAAERRLDYEAAVEHLRTGLQHNPRSVRLLVALGDVLCKQQKHTAALKAYDRALKMNAQDLGALTNSAWCLATCPNEKVRDGKKAIERAKRCLKLVESDDRFKHLLPSVRDTLAAALAETGQFSQAVRAQKAALAALRKTDPEIRAEFEHRLALYREKKPFRSE